jgi:hypothetical protein
VPPQEPSHWTVEQRLRAHLAGLQNDDSPEPFDRT